MYAYDAHAFLCAYVCMCVKFTSFYVKSLIILPRLSSHADSRSVDQQSREQVPKVHKE